MLDFLDKKAITMLDASSGINHIYITGEYRSIASTDPNLDFSDNFFNAGLTFEF